MWARCRAALARLLHPGPGEVLCLTLAAAAGLGAVFANGWQEAPAAYGVYAFSTYALAVLAAGVPGMVRWGGALLHRNSRVARLLDDREYRAHAALYGSLAVNVGYAGLKLGMSWLYASPWFLAVGVYNLVLGVLRFLLLRGAAGTLRRQLAACRACGYGMLALNAALAGMAAQMIWRDQGTRYPGLAIYAAAAYAFYNLTAAAVNAVRFHRSAGPVPAAAKLLNLACALVSLFSLQTAMLAEFDQAGRMPRRTMNTATGTAMCVLLCVLALHLIRCSGRRLRAMNETEKGAG